MEPEKKLSRTGSTRAMPCAELPGQLPQPATHFLGLGDDIFGIVYGMLEDSASKRALRTCCAALWRSPSVNKRLDELVFSVKADNPQEGFGDTFIDFAQAIPKNVTLRALKVVYAGDPSQLLLGFPATIFQRALYADAIAVRERLKSVHRLTIIGCDLDGSVAACLSALAPRFQDPGGAGELTVERCIVHPDFIKILPTLFRLKGLAFELCNFENEAECFSCFKYFTTLTMLNVSVHPFDCMDVECFDSFAGLQQLESLQLGSMALLSFDALLRTLPRLHNGYNGYNGYNGLELPYLYPDFPELWKDNFPAIQVVRLGGLFLSGRNAEEHSDQEKLDKLSCMATFLATMPLVNCYKKGVDSFTLVGHHGWSEELNVSMLNALSPLKQHFRTTTSFALINFNVALQAFIPALCNLTGGSVRELSLIRCVYSREVLRQGLLVLMVQAMQCLKHLSMSFSSGVPRDLLAALTAAVRANRHLTMDFRGSEASCTARLQELHEQWCALKALVYGPVMTDFVV